MEQLEETEQRHTYQYEANTPPGAVATEIIGKSGQHTGQQFVLHITVEPFRSSTFRPTLPCLIRIHLFVANLLGRANPLDDILHVFYGNGFHALGLLFREQFGYSGLDVVEYLSPVLLLAEVVAQTLLVVVQQLVSILVDIVELAEKVNGYILFHTLLILIRPVFDFNTPTVWAISVHA